MKSSVSAAFLLSKISSSNCKKILKWTCEITDFEQNYFLIMKHKKQNDRTNYLCVFIEPKGEYLLQKDKRKIVIKKYILMNKKHLF